MFDFSADLLLTLKVWVLIGGSTRFFIRSIEYVLDGLKQLVAKVDPKKTSSNWEVERERKSTAFERGHVGKFLFCPSDTYDLPLVVCPIVGLFF